MAANARIPGSGGQQQQYQALDTTTGEFDDLANEYGLTKQEIVEAAKNDPSLYSLLMGHQSDGVGTTAAAVDSSVTGATAVEEEELVDYDFDDDDELL
jgi:hypothetical protein